MNERFNQSPSVLGYRVPAEWEPHAATWIAWPRNRSTWPDQSTWPDRLGPIPGVFTRLVETLSCHEPVHVLAGGEAVMHQARSQLDGLTNVTLHDIPTNDCWIRDHGPIFLTGPDTLPPALVDWDYNAWGGKYPPFEQDNAVPQRIAQSTGYRRFTPGIVLEGGAIDTDGHGTFLVAERSLLDAKRNPGCSRAEVERYLTEYLAARKVLWLDAVIAGDDTDGHVDQTTRFVGPSTVIVAFEHDPSDANFDSLSANRQRLSRMTDAFGRALEIIPIPMPRPIQHAGQRLPASYMNFYIANGLVVVPRFDDPADAEAIAVLDRCFPKRRIVGLPAIELILGLGAFHCVTQQEPRGEWAMSTHESRS